MATKEELYAAVRLIKEHCKTKTEREFRQGGAVMADLKPHLYPCRCCGLFPSISPLGSKWYICCSDNLCPCTVTVVAADRNEGIDIWNNLNTPNEGGVTHE